MRTLFFILFVASLSAQQTTYCFDSSETVAIYEIFGQRDSLEASLIRTDTLYGRVLNQYKDIVVSQNEEKKFMAESLDNKDKIIKAEKLNNAALQEFYAKAIKDEQYLRKKEARKAKLKLRGFQFGTAGVGILAAIFALKT
jgi:hypothetical protein